MIWNWGVNKLVLSVEHVSRSIKGKQILEDVTLRMEPGKAYGFVGRNGSGKTMLFRAISGLIRIDSGEVRWGDSVLHKDFDILPNLGISLENAGLYPDLTGFQNLKQLADIRKVIHTDDIRMAISRVGLDPDDQRTYKKYSLGMKQRIVFAQAIMEHPAIIMLDEPTNGLDTDGAALIRGIIQEEKERGAIVLLASHNREDIHLLADEVFRIEEGRLSREGKNA